jgi:hypothetical protein
MQDWASLSQNGAVVVAGHPAGLGEQSASRLHAPLQ